MVSNLSQLTISGLRHIIVEAGLSHDGIVEKEDLLERAQQAQAILASRTLDAADVQLSKEKSALLHDATSSDVEQGVHGMRRLRVDSERSFACLATTRRRSQHRTCFGAAVHPQEVDGT